MNMGKGRAGLAIQPRSTVVGSRTGCLAEITADTDILIDQQHLRRLTQALAHQKGQQVTGFSIRLQGHILRVPFLDQGLQSFFQALRALQQQVKRRFVDRDSFGFDRRCHRCSARRITQ